MSDTSFTDPITLASAALAVARKVRANAAASALNSLNPGALHHIDRVGEAFEGLEAFSEGFLYELRQIIGWCDEAVATGTTTDYETYETCDEQGGEATAVHPVQVMTQEARRVNALLADLRQMASLIERTLDLVAAHAIVVGQRSSGPLAAAPWRRMPPASARTYGESPDEC